MVQVKALLAKPWIWSFVGAFLVWIAAVAFTRGHGGGGMIIAALSLAVFMVIVGIGQMFVITLGPGNVDLSLPANIGLASAVAMKVMDGNDSMVAIGLLAALACGFAIGAANYLLIWALRIPPIIATLSAAFIIQSIDISYGRGLQIKPPPGFADWAAFDQSLPAERQGSAYACVDPDGVGPRLFFQKVPEGKTVKNRVHLDVRVGAGMVGDERLAALEAERDRLLALGAKEVRVMRADEFEESCIVMQDVEGNEFCLD